MAEHLEHGDSRAAIVISTDPELLIAAYTDELDCIAMLRLPKMPLGSVYLKFSRSIKLAEVVIFFSK